MLLATIWDKEEVKRDVASVITRGSVVSVATLLDESTMKKLDCDCGNV
jgi:hypothetical protein